MPRGDHRVIADEGRTKMIPVYYDMEGKKILVDEAEAEECPICHNMRSRSKRYCEHCGYAWGDYPQTAEETNLIADAIAPYLV